MDTVIETNRIVDPLEHILEPLEVHIKAKGWHEGYNITLSSSPASATEPDGAINIIIRYNATASATQKVSAIERANLIGKELGMTRRQADQRLELNGYQIVSPVEAHLSTVTLQINASAVSLNHIRGSILKDLFNKNSLPIFSSTLLWEPDPQPLMQWTFSTSKRTQGAIITVLEGAGLTQVPANNHYPFTQPRQFAKGGISTLNDNKSSSSSYRTLSIQASAESFYAIRNTLENSFRNTNTNRR